MAILLTKIGPVVLPVARREQHVFSADLTENPVETGASVTDNYIKKPRQLTLEVAADAPQIIWQVLKRVREDARPFNVVTGLDVYQSMMIKDVSVERDFSSARILSGSIQLQEVIFAETARIAVEANQTPKESKAGGATKPTSENTPEDSDTQERAADTTHRGDNPTNDAPTDGDGAEATKNRSILSGILNPSDPDADASVPR